MGRCGQYILFRNPLSSSVFARFAVQSQLAASLNCLVIGWELSGGDGLWCWCIYLLCADRKLFLCPDWLGLITAASVALFNPVRLGRVCLLTQWDVHEDERKTFPNLGWHWRPGKQSSLLLPCKWVDMKLRFLWEKVCCIHVLNMRWLFHTSTAGWIVTICKIQLASGAKITSIVLKML